MRLLRPRRSLVMADIQCESGDQVGHGTQVETPGCPPARVCRKLRESVHPESGGQGGSSQEAVGCGSASYCQEGKSCNTCHPRRNQLCRVIALRVRKREHRKPATNVILAVDPCQSVEVRELPESLHDKKRPWLKATEAAPRRCEPHEDRQRAGNGTNVGVVRGQNLHRGVYPSVQRNSATCDCRCHRVDSSSKHSHAHCGQTTSQHLCVALGDMPHGQRSSTSAVHLRVALLLDNLVDHLRAS
mmetsp:Transcript_33731/g.81671  ORF Transcript_33731/g.81671 Transcript_33731/m.81671 type:complete len:244 (-) Transcript_33731:392-1123(-)